MDGSAVLRVTPRMSVAGAFFDAPIVRTGEPEFTAKLPPDAGYATSTKFGFVVMLLTSDSPLGRSPMLLPPLLAVSLLEKVLPEPIATPQPLAPQALMSEPELPYMALLLNTELL